MRTYIITGANGFVGNNIIRELNSTHTNVKIRALVLPNADLRSLNGLECRVFSGDITKPKTLIEPFSIKAAECTEGLYIIHCAGIIDIEAAPNPSLRKTNVEGTKNVIDVASSIENKTGIRPKFIYISSVHAIPESPKGETMIEPLHFSPDKVVGQYAKSKAEVTQYVFEAISSGIIDGCVVLPSEIIGPFDFSPENMNRLVQEVANGKLFATVKGGYDFVDVRDVAKGIIACCEKGANGENYILSNRSVAIKEICDDVRLFFGKSPIRVVLPIGLVKVAASFFESYYRRKEEIPLFTSCAMHTLQSNSSFSHKKAASELDYTTRSVQDTVFDMVSWMEAVGAL